ncbi:MAG: T9SS type A sorting domain-containing protein [Candidatus Marinimicrobia bacterium]|nr:T9SS type A sorting domain-containing protein [Candidatus Neomarinimicrobiota bacterium]
MRVLFSTVIKAIVLLILTSGLAAEPSFENRPIVQIPGDNKNFEISDVPVYPDSTIFICWENWAVDTSSIYRMVLAPSLGSPELIASSIDSMCNPVVNSDGDIVWQQKDNDFWIYKLYSQATQEISSISFPMRRTTAPALSGRILLFVEEDSLKHYNLFYRTGGIVDTGIVANPDISPLANSGFWIGLYEKHSDTSSTIWQCIKFRDTNKIELYTIDSTGMNENPRFGVYGEIAYQTLVNDVWGIGFGDHMAPLVHSFNSTNPFIFSPITVARREVRTELLFFEGDSIPGNLEIYATSQFGGKIYNISNLPGNDYNPQLTLFNWIQLGLVWEHEGENGREIWMGLDTLKIGTSVFPESSNLPISLRVQRVFPNPFNNRVGVDYVLHKAGHIQITVRDINGRSVSEFKKYQPTGEHHYFWDASDLNGHDVSSGMYILTISNGQKWQSRKIVLLK